MRFPRTRNRRAGAAVELAALLPFLAYLAVIGTDWARLLYYTITVESCARAGALYAADPTTKGESPYADTTAAALGASPGLKPTPTVTEASDTVDGRSGVKVTVSMPFKTITHFPGVPASQTISRSVRMRTFPVTPD